MCCLYLCLSVGVLRVGEELLGMRFLKLKRHVTEAKERKKKLEERK